MKTIASLLLGLCLAASVVRADEVPAYPPLHLPDTSGWGRNIQRTMRLLATSTPEHRNTVRILFYGQSITEQSWSRLVEADLRRRFPHANLIVENRALGGFAAQMLVKTAETDLYPFQPDLLIFHVYGANDKYEDIIRRVRERTTAEILLQNDHVLRAGDFTEETDPAKLEPKKEQWDAFMNQRWIPLVAKKYGAELCDQRSLWKTYLKENQLEPSALLKDTVHLNAHGEWLMAQCVSAYLRYDPALGSSLAEAWVKTYPVDGAKAWDSGWLELAFTGTRVDLVFASGPEGTAAVRIDGRKPSAWPELYGFTHPSLDGYPWAKWPLIAPIGSASPLVVEEWALAAHRTGPEDSPYEFTVTGSTTGSDGAGRSDARFVSSSGRIVIEPADWNVAYALMLPGIKPSPADWTLRWRVVPYFVDEFTSPATVDPTTETTLTLAQGLPDRPHTLELVARGRVPTLKAIRIYRPAQR